MDDGAMLTGPRKRISIDWWLVAIILLPCLYFLPELLGLNVFSGIDTTRLNMPIRLFDRQAFAAGAIPLWNPYMFAGFPALAESESGVFYPGNIFIHMPGDFFHWYSAEVVAHFIIAAAGFYAWMRIRGHSRFTSAFLAATYSTTPFLIFHITAFGLFTSIVWLPWYAVIFEKGLKSEHPFRIGLWFALFLAIMLMAGSVQAVFLGIFALIIYAFAIILIQHDHESRKHALLRSLAILAPGLIAPVIAAVQVLPTAELTGMSERVSTETLRFFEIGTWLNVPRLVSILIFPAIENPEHLQDYGSSLCYMGAVPLIFALSSIALSVHRRDRALVPLIAVGIMAIILAFGLNLPGYQYIVEIPPFNMFRYPGRMAHVALTFFLPLAGPAIDVFAKLIKGEEIDSLDSWWSGYAVGMVLVMLVSLGGILFGPAVLRVSFGIQLFFGIIALFAYTAPKSARSHGPGAPAFILIALSLLLSVAVQVFLTYPFSRALVQKRGSFDESLRFFDDVKAQFPTGMEIPRVCYAGSHILFDPDMMSKVRFSPQEDVWDSMSGNAAGLREVTSIRALTPLNQYNWKLVERDTLQSRIDTVLNNSIQNGAPKIPDAVSMRIIRMLGADVLLLEGDDWQVPGYELWRTDLALPFHEGLCAYRAIGDLVPDAYFVDTVDAGTWDYAGFLRWIGSGDLDIDHSALVENVAGHELEGEFASTTDAQVIDRKRGYNWMSFDVRIEGDSPGFLITGENFYPGWKAYVDGVETPIYNADFVLSGIIVPPGEHMVLLRYLPRSVIAGMMVSLSGMAIWVILMATAIWIHRRERKSVIARTEENDEA